MVTNQLPQLPSAPTSLTQSAAAPTSMPPPIQKFGDFEIFQDPAAPIEAASPTSQYASLPSQAPSPCQPFLPSDLALPCSTNQTKPCDVIPLPYAKSLTHQSAIFIVYVHDKI
jgi:hypothetical protein